MMGKDRNESGKCGWITTDNLAVTFITKTVIAFLLNV